MISAALSRDRKVPRSALLSVNACCNRSFRAFSFSIVCFASNNAVSNSLFLCVNDFQSSVHEVVCNGDPTLFLLHPHKAVSLAVLCTQGSYSY